jgi:asparagine synthase (glutamine-hydrolysing)
MLARANTDSAPRCIIFPVEIDMCGLVARLRPGAAINVGRGISLVSAAAERLRHRGPDGWRLRAVGHAVLGHRRLSIIDVARGGQPLLSEDGRIALVRNGEIYNHERLGARLEERPRRPRSGAAGGARGAARW